MSVNVKESDVRALIGYLLGIPDFQDAKVLVVGGVALNQYIPQPRDTENIDILVDVPYGFDTRLRPQPPYWGPEAMQNRLMRMYPAIFEHQMRFVMRRQGGQSAQGIRIQFLPDQVGPYVPEKCVSIDEIRQTGEIPYISPLDLMVFKISSCGLRGSEIKRQTDAQDAVDLVEDLRRQNRLRLSPSQKEVLREPLLDDIFVDRSGHSRNWWMLVLRLDPLV